MSFVTAQWASPGAESLGNLPQVTQLISGWANIWDKTDWFQSPDAGLPVHKPMVSKGCFCLGISHRKWLTVTWGHTHQARFAWREAKPDLEGCAVWGNLWCSESQPRFRLTSSPTWAHPCFCGNTTAPLSIGFPWGPVTSGYILSSIRTKCKANVKILLWLPVILRTNVWIPSEAKRTRIIYCQSCFHFSKASLTWHCMSLALFLPRLHWLVSTA